MTPAELARFDQALLEATTYLEYGAGHSTKRALMFENITRIDSVESSQEFIDQELLTDDEVSDNVKSGRLKIHHVDIGETAAWGMPRDGSAKERWPIYAEQIHAKGSTWDTVLVDGRFRVSCILHTMLNLPDCTLLVHDFWNRRHYHEVLDFLVVVDSVDTLGVFRRKAKIDERELRRLIGTYRYTPA